jgi:lipid-binding SYLF domain-containing protein
VLPVTYAPIGISPMAHARSPVDPVREYPAPACARPIGPAFYNLATASVGFQADISVSETIALVMSDKGMNSLLTDAFKLGPDASFAVGPLGAWGKGDIPVDFVAHSRSKGLYGGLNLDGTVVSVADGWNDRYYGQKLLPPDILLRASAHKAQADRLVALLELASNGTRPN